jgi:hypothetical protein
LAGIPEVPIHAAGFSWRVAASIVIGVGWLSFIIIWLFFFAGSYSIYQNLAIVVVSLIVGFGALILIWITWGLRFATPVESIDLDWKEQRRNWFGWRGTVSGIIWFAWLAVLVIWLFFFAQDYDVYQNIAIIIVSLVVAGGASAIIWSSIGWHER